MLILFAFLIVLGSLFLSLPTFGEEMAGKDSTFDTLPQQESLQKLVREYLNTESTEKSKLTLAKILPNPEANIEYVSNLIRTSKVYQSAPVGFQPNQSIRVRGHDLSYGLFVPDTYQPDEAFPLVVCLHGAGFTGDSYLKRWATRLKESYLLACPSYSMGMWWTRLGEELVLATIKTVRRRYHIDPDRIYLTGMSNGGIGTWIIGMHRAPIFAAIAPMASGIDDVLFPFLQNLSQTSLYVIHGAKDQVMPVRLSRNITKRLKALGIAYIYREHERVHPHAGGHYFPKEELPTLIAWLGQQKRNRYPRMLTVVRDASHLTDFGWIRVDSTDHIAMFSEELVDMHDDLMQHQIYAKLEVQIRGESRIEVTTERIRRYTLFLNSQLVDLSKPITVVTNGQVSYEGHITLNLETLLREARRRGDFERLFPIQLSIDVKS